MFKPSCVLALMALHVGVAHSWDIAVSVKDQIIFYTNGTKTNTVNLISQNPTALSYDEVHNMMLYVDKQTNNDAICGYYLSSKDNKCFIKRNGRNIHGLAFDPVTEIIFFTDTNEKSIYWISLKSGCNNNIHGNLLIKMDGRTPNDIAVDSCRGYIYWTNTNSNGIERAQFNGSNQEVIKKTYYNQFSIVIDSQTQKMLYFDINPTVGNGFLNKNNLNGTDERLLLRNFHEPRSLSKVLTVSKDYLYWKNSSESYDSVWQLPKNAASDVEPKEISKIYDARALGITARYKKEDQIKGIQDCVSLSSLIPTTSVAPVYIGERSDASACEDYCLHGSCIFSVEGLPKCRCNAGYSGQRCDVNLCHNYCLNDGECSLNEEDEPICQCVGNHKGSRCEVETTDITPAYDLAKRNLTVADLLSTFRKPSSKMYLTVEV